MSNSNSVQKVLRVAIRRVEKRWGKQAWSKKGRDGQYHVCLEGAITGGCEKPQTHAQQGAMDLTRQILREDGKFTTLPAFNDSATTTQDDVLGLLKKALIRSETGGLIEDTEFLSK